MTRPARGTPRPTIGPGDRLSLVALSPVAEEGGAEVLLVDVLAGLRDRGLSVTLLVLGQGPLPERARSRALGVRVGPPLSFRRPASVLGAAAFVHRALRQLHPHVVLASHAKAQLLSRLACAGTSAIQATQLYDPPATSPSSRLAIRLAGPSFAISAETAAAHVAANPKLRPVVIPPGCDIELLQARSQHGDCKGVWDNAGVPYSSGRRIVMVGRLQQFKGVFDFVEMAAAVRRLEPDARFLLIGPDSPIEPGLRAELESDIATRGMQGALGLAGRIEASDVAATIADATLLVHPAHREPFGLVVLEAMALGTPVVAYASSGPRSLLQEGAGRLVPVGDVPLLAAAVAGALANPSRLEGWGGQGSVRSRHFDLAHTIEEYRRALWQLAAGGPEPSPTGERRR